MKVSGSSEVGVEPEAAFSRLLDPEVLKQCIPGCEEMTESSPGVYETLIRAGVGAVKGRFEGKVSLSDVERPSSYRMSVSGKSTVGYVDGGAHIRLEPTDGGTRIVYDGEAKVSGLIASVGGRLIDAAAKKQARQFFDELARVVGAS